MIDVALIVGGLLVLPFHPVAGGALFGAGVSGLVTDAFAAWDNSNDNTAWGIQVAAGGLLGAFGGPAANFVKSGFRAGSKAVVRGGARAALKNVFGQTIRNIAVDAAIGGTLGAVQQVGTNAYNGDPLGKDVLQSAGLGALFGAAGSAVSGRGMCIALMCIAPISNHVSCFAVEKAYQRVAARIQLRSATTRPDIRLMLVRGSTPSTSSGRSSASWSLLDHPPSFGHDLDLPWIDGPDLPYGYSG